MIRVTRVCCECSELSSCLVLIGREIAESKGVIKDYSVSHKGCKSSLGGDRGGLA